jgi:hypothetical protein
MTATVRVATYTRQTEILDPGVASRTHITVCGAGTVGSNAAIQLAKAGFGSFEIIDMDVVEPHNLPSQDFSLDDLGQNKAKAVAKRIRSLSHHAKAVAATSPLMGGEMFHDGIVIMAVDNMELRKALFNQSVVTNPSTRWVMDFRMAGNFLWAWCVDTNNESDVEKYRKTLYSSEETTSELPCGGRTFAPVGALAGAVATQFATQIVSDDKAPPFHTFIDFGQFSMMTVGVREPGE